MINSRALILAGGFLLILLLLTAKLFMIQISGHEYYSLIAERQQNRPAVIKADRGTITDADGEVLSLTRKDVSFFVDKRMMDQQKVDSIASAFARICGKTKDYYQKIIDEGFNNICIEKKVSMDKAIELKKIVIDGLYHQDDYTRVYPYANLAANVLGFVDRDMNGVEGLEKLFNNDLTGKDGNYLLEQDVLGRTLSVDEDYSKAATPGHDVVLTIKKNFQKILEDELVNGLNKFGGQSAVGIIMNPNTGDILALATLPTFDPSKYEDFSAEARKNKALTDTYEPGSTMKPIIMSMLLDQNLVNANEVINTENGVYSYKGKRFVDAHKEASMTVRQVIELSSDIGMIKLSDRVSDEMFYKYVRDYGFGNKTLIDLPSESDGLLKKPSDFRGRTKATMSFGYEISVTPLQMINAYCALINGGTLLEPRIVKEIKDHSGKVLTEFTVKKIRTVVKSSSSDIIRNFMVGVVEAGTAKEAHVDNIMIGGKTGTSEMYQASTGTYSESKHNSSFIGFFPADKPNIVCLILVTSPEKAKFGGDVAAPIFREITKKLIQTDINLVPNKYKPENKQKAVNELIADIKTTPAKNSAQFAHPADKNLSGANYRQIQVDNRNVIPNLINMTVRDAMAQLRERGVEYNVVGNGKVIWQSIEPGASIVPGMVCNLRCQRSGIKVTTGTN
jgi:cell division protein FtsI (penicillin-binding protein 3)